MAGDFGRFQPLYGMSNVDITLPLIQPILILCKGPTKSICVQNITFTSSSITAAVLQFVDDITLEVIGSLSIPAIAPPISNGTFFLTFGPTGTKLSPGANLILGVNPASQGASGRLHIEAYQRGPISVVVPTPAPRTAGFTA